MMPVPPKHGRLVQAMTPVLNSHPSQYMTIHQYERIVLKIRKKHVCILKIYTIDYFPKCSHIHQQASPSITVA